MTNAYLEKHLELADIVTRLGTNPWFCQS